MWFCIDGSKKISIEPHNVPSAKLLILYPDTNTCCLRKDAILHRKMFTFLRNIQYNDFHTLKVTCSCINIYVYSKQIHLLHYVCISYTVGSLHQKKKKIVSVDTIFANVKYRVLSKFCEEVLILKITRTNRHDLNEYVQLTHLLENQCFIAVFFL